MTREVLSCWIVILGMITPSVALTQQRPPDVVGFLRTDGVALPIYEFTQNQWSHIGGAYGPTDPDLPIWGMIETYFGRTPEGKAFSVAAGAPVPSGGWDYEPAYGQETDLEPMEGPGYFQLPVPRVGYITTDGSRHAHFETRPNRFSEAQLQILFDSLAPIPDSVTSRLFENRSWSASIDGEEWVFFRATRFAVVGPYDPCFTVQGWWDPESDPRSAFLAAVGKHDCEWKGEAAFIPWALFRRNSSTYALTTKSGWADWYAEIWLRHADGSWSRQATTCLHCN